MCNYILETASFSIRNLKINNDEENWNFPLNESKGEDVHDNKGRIIGLSQALPGSSIVRIIGNSYFNLTLPLHRVSPLHRKSRNSTYTIKTLSYPQYL
ncbi:MAG: hypothetical protein ACLUE2_13580 [Bacteroides cellulosilyticus]